MKLINLIFLLTFFSCGNINDRDVANNVQNNPITVSKNCQCSDEEGVVCGQDGISYYNECYRNCFKVAFQQNGECSYNNEIMCTAVFQPVCGFNGITYSNSCVASKANVTSVTEGSCR